MEVSILNQISPLMSPLRVVVSIPSENRLVFPSKTHASPKSARPEDTVPGTETVFNGCSVRTLSASQKKSGVAIN